MLVEDDDVLRKSLVYYLGSNGFEIDDYDNGEDAMQQLRTESPDLLITDLNLPFAGGQSLISLLRNENASDIPVIVLTAHGVESTELEVFNLGADEFISKPFSPAVLLARISKLLRKH